MALLRGQQRAHRAIGRHRVAGGTHRAEAIAAVRIGMEAAAQVAVGLRRVLVVVQADRRSLPHLDQRAGQRRAVGAAHGAADQQRQAGRVVLHHAVAAGIARRVGTVERSQQGAGRAAVAGAVVHHRHQRRQTQHVGREHDLVVRGVRRVAKAGEPAQRELELLIGQARLAQEAVQMPDQRIHDEAQAWAGGVRHGGLDDAGDRMFVVYQRGARDRRYLPRERCFHVMPPLQTFAALSAAGAGGQGENLGQRLPTRRSPTKIAIKTSRYASCSGQTLGSSRPGGGWHL
ncbi:hypothetical protein D3C81_1216030 [compost metagenome]